MERSASNWNQGPGLIESVWRYRWWIAVAAIVGGALGFVLSLVQPTVYQAEARLVLGDPRAASIFLDRARPAVDPQRHLAKQAERIVSRDVLEAALERLDTSMSVGDLRGSLGTAEHPLVDALAVIATAPMAQLSADMANAVGQAYQEIIAAEINASAQAAIAELNEAAAEASVRLSGLQDQLGANPDDAALAAEVEVSTQQIIAISTRAQQLAVEAALYGSGVEAFEPADPPGEPSQPRPARTTAVGIVLGMFAAGAFGWWRAEQNVTADASGDVAAVLEAPLLGEVPVFRSQRGSQAERPFLNNLDPWSVEAYQFVVASLQFALDDVQGTSVAVTSVDQGDGKTVTAMNLAFVAAQDGRRVILLDGDERVQGLSKTFGLQGRHGLSDVVAGALPLSSCRDTQMLPDSPHPVRVIPAGARIGQVAGFFRRPEFRIAMATLRSEADLLVVDTPPLLAVSDVLQIAGHADGVVVVVSKGTPVKRLREAKERLALVGTPILGFVFNRAKGRQRSSPYYTAQPTQKPGAPRSGEGDDALHRGTWGTSHVPPAPPVPKDGAVAVKGHPSPEEAALARFDAASQLHVIAVEDDGDEARVLVDGVPSNPMVIPCVRRNGLWFDLPAQPLEA